MLCSLFEGEGKKKKSPRRAKKEKQLHFFPSWHWEEKRKYNRAGGGEEGKSIEKKGENREHSLPSERTFDKKIFYPRKKKKKRALKKEKKGRFISRASKSRPGEGKKGTVPSSIGGKKAKRPKRGEGRKTDPPTVAKEKSTLHEKRKGTIPSENRGLPLIRGEGGG